MLLYAENTSEDPERGAHAEYLEEILPVADEVETFHAGASDTDICAFLNAGLSASHEPSVRPAPAPARPPRRAATARPPAPTQSTMPTHRKAPLLAVYAEKHPAQVARFGAEVERLLDALKGMRDDSLRHGLRRSHDPREIEHQARIYEARFKPPAGPAQTPDAHPTSKAQRPKPPPAGRKSTLDLVGDIPERPRYTGVGPDARYCGACGLLEVLCKC